MLNKGLIRRALAILLSLTLLLPTFSMADSAYDYDATHPAQVDDPNMYTMTADAIIARPLLLLATVAGTGLFIVSLPFSALGGNVGKAKEELVVKPARATFVRCLGCINEQPPERLVSNTPPRRSYHQGNFICPRSELDASGQCPGATTYVK